MTQTIDPGNRPPLPMDAADSYHWFLEFQAHRLALSAGIEGMAGEGVAEEGMAEEGMAEERDRLTYATLILARLILICFLQTQGWLDHGDRWYLQNKLGQSQQRGVDQFYSAFLNQLWFQGFALPEAERLATVQALVGRVPHLSSSLFQPHRLEQQWDAIQIADSHFERILDWFSDYHWQWQGGESGGQPSGTQPSVTLTVLQQSFQYSVTEAHGRAYALAPEVIQSLCDSIVTQQLLDRVATVSGQTFPGIKPLLQALDGPLADQLKHQILPRFRILDPACGSGALLIGAIETLLPIYQAVEAQRLPSSQSGSEHQLLDLACNDLACNDLACNDLVCTILTHNLYGVDLDEAAIELARLQLFLQVLSRTPQDAELVPLPLIEYNVMAGNALIGLVQVDGEGFDQIGPKASSIASSMPPGGKKGQPVQGDWAPHQVPNHQPWQAQASSTPPPASKPRLWQGNLLQPLMAENYRTIVAEKQIHLERYHSQTRLMAEVATVPAYVQTEFLRDQIQALNHKAQGKLDQLLLNEFSQKLGIRYCHYQPQQGMRKRILKLADIQRLNPFHWGYQFHRVLTQGGGFDVILSDLPWGALRATPQQFLSRYRSLAQRRQLDSKAFRRSRSQLLQTDAELAGQWSVYRSEFTYVRDYFRQADHYRYQQINAARPSPASPVYLERLFIERCVQLLNPAGRAALGISGSHIHELRQGTLTDLLLQQQLAPMVICANHHHLARGLDKRQQFGLIRFQCCQQRDRASTDPPDTDPPDPVNLGQWPMQTYLTAADAPTPATWGTLLATALERPDL